MQHVLVLDEPACGRLLAGPALLDRLADGFRALSSGDVVAPLRTEVVLDSGFSLAMPAYRRGGDIVVKIAACINARVPERAFGDEAPTAASKRHTLEF